MKKLDQYRSEGQVSGSSAVQISEADEKKRLPKEKLSSILPVTIAREEAVEKKLEKLRVKLFGFTLGKFEVGEMRDVWVPYSLMTYHFLIDRRTIFNRSGALDRRGEMNFIFDYNEVHPFQYDMADGGLSMKKANLEEIGGVILSAKATEKEARDKMEWHIQNRVLRRVYSTDGKITFEGEKKFYRAAVEIKVYYGENENIRYAYLDEYGVDSEHILGLKYRMG